MFVSDEDANLLRLNKNRLEKRTKRPHHIVCVRSVWYDDTRCGDGGEVSK